MPYLSVDGMLWLHSDWFLILQGTLANPKTPFIIFGAIPVLTLNISVICCCRIRRCKVVELSFLSSSSEDESKHLYITRKALSWSLLMWTFNFCLWNIQTTVKNEEWQIVEEFIISLPCSKFIDDASLYQTLFFDLHFYIKIQNVL